MRGRCNFEGRSTASIRADRQRHLDQREVLSSSSLISGPLSSRSARHLTRCAATWTRIDVIYSSTCRSLNTKTRGSSLLLWPFFYLSLLRSSSPFSRVERTAETHSPWRRFDFQRRTTNLFFHLCFERSIVYRTKTIIQRKVYAFLFPSRSLLVSMRREMIFW